MVIGDETDISVNVSSKTCCARDDGTHFLRPYQKQVKSRNSVSSAGQYE